MKRSIFYFVLGGLVVTLPVLAAPAFVGPSTAPPGGNVNGVIWNLPLGSPPQTANVNISGDVKTNNVNTNNVTLNSDLIVSDSKSLTVVPVTSGATADYHIKPSSATVGTYSGLKLDVEGSVVVTTPLGFGGPFTIGKDGRVQADKICFNPGNPADCITAWSGPGGPGGGGAGTLTGITAGTGIKVTGAAPSPTVSVDPLYYNGMTVLKAGDTMTGGLTIQSNTPLTIKDGGGVTLLSVTPAGSNLYNGGFSSNNIGGTAISGHGSTGGSFSNTAGTQAYAAYASGGVNYGIYANAVGGSDTGAYFNGGAFGVDAKSNGSGTAVRGTNGAIGANFSGTNFGVLAYGGTNGSYFTNSLGQATYVGMPNYGFYSSVGAANYGLYTDGQVYTSAKISGGSVYSSGSLTAGGDLDASNNTWGGPASPSFDSKYGWPNMSGPTPWLPNATKCGTYGGVVATGYWICPSGSYMAGYHLDGSGKVDNGVCCEL